MSLYLGNTPIAHSQDISGKANLNLDNSTAITNCITEIPQDIKLELNNGTLTLKAGSKVYVPNGADVFDVVTITSDIVANTPSSNVTAFIVYDSDRGNVYANIITSDCGSGSTNPTTGSGYFYNTTTNILTYHEGSTYEERLYSLPLGIITKSDSGIIIDQVFNGFGYIGSTTFVLPGVKGLIPDGRNNDGSLKSIAKTITNVGVITYTEHNPNRIYLIIRSTGLSLNGAYSYIESSNLVYNENNIENSFILASFTNTNGRVTDFSPRSILHALGYNDSSTISSWSMPSGRYIDLTLGASGTSYTAPANGWAWLDKSTTSAQYITLQNVSAAGIRSSSVYYGGGMYLAVILPVKKGDVFMVEYNAAGTLNAFKFIYSEGENV